MKIENHEKPWVKYYDAAVPGSLEYPNWTLVDLLRNTADKYPMRIALICGNRRMNYYDLYWTAQYFSFTLIREGLEPGERVGICLPNGIDFVVAFFATLMGGGIVAAMNPNYPLPEWQYQTAIARPAILIGLESRNKDLMQLKKECNSKALILTNDSEEGGSFPLSFVDFAPERASVYFPDVTGSHGAVLQFSGGTTGSPKAALALHKNVVANVMQFKRWLTTMEEGREVFLTMIPLYHVYGMVIGLNVGIAMGATIVLVSDGRDLTKVLSLVPEHGVTFFPGVPSIYNAINHHPRVLAGEINLRSIKACISGSAPLPEDTRKKFETLTGGKLVEGYGLSEAPTATHCNPIQGENRNGSIGLPLPDVDCRIVDLEDDSREVATGGEGELLIRSPQIMKEYFLNPAETTAVLKDGWLHTGDIARMDQDGYFYIVGRRKELIKVNGLQVWPREIEEVILKYPGVKEVSAAGVPDADSGEAVKAWLVVDSSGSFDMQNLAGFCRKSLAGYKIPKEVEIVQELPKSPVGKVLRRELVRMHEEGKKNRERS